MYRVKKDKRTINSANKIVDALNKTIKEKCFENIGVSDISEKAGVSRSTFYRIFDNLVDVIEYKVDCEFDDIALKLDSSETDEDIIPFVLQMCFEKKETLEMAFACNQARIIITSFRRSLDKHKRLVQKYDDPKQLPYNYCMMVMMVMGAVIVWVEEGQKESIDQLLKRIETFKNDLIENKLI